MAHAPFALSEVAVLFVVIACQAPRHCRRDDSAAGVLQRSARGAHLRRAMKSQSSVNIDVLVYLAGSRHFALISTAEE